MLRFIDTGLVAQGGQVVIPIILTEAVPDKYSVVVRAYQLSCLEPVSFQFRSLDMDVNLTPAWGLGTVGDQATMVAPYGEFPWIVNVMEDGLEMQIINLSATDNARYNVFVLYDIVQDDQLDLQVEERPT